MREILKMQNLQGDQRKDLLENMNHLFNQHETDIKKKKDPIDLMREILKMQNLQGDQHMELLENMNHLFNQHETDIKKKIDPIDPSDDSEQSSISDSSWSKNDVDVIIRFNQSYKKERTPIRKRSHIFKASDSEETFQSTDSARSSSDSDSSQSQTDIDGLVHYNSSDGIAQHISPSDDYHGGRRSSARRIEKRKKQASYDEQQSKINRNRQSSDSSDSETTSVSESSDQQSQESDHPYHSKNSLHSEIHNRSPKQSPQNYDKQRTPVKRSPVISRMVMADQVSSLLTDSTYGSERTVNSDTSSINDVDVIIRYNVKDEIGQQMPLSEYPIISQVDPLESKMEPVKSQPDLNKSQSTPIINQNTAITTQTITQESDQGKASPELLIDNLVTILQPSSPDQNQSKLSSKK
ncbi:MAG: hypothetical protein EZS28_024933 [Streblomastix strix]|uniref:Uncharacterized protein n=1 Tax=Streblomastix strix TaxID=222440 RepID=A0A5J4VAM5_9EUKA|nr:MAG: hypothetical protein EZS28_024933 [Streblomastix strix]